MNRFGTTIALGGCLAALACAPARAEDDNTVRLGMYFVSYHAHADDVSGPFTPPGLNANVNNVNTLYFAYLRSLTTHLQVELTAGLPPQTDTVGKGPNTVGSVPYNGQVLGHVTWFAPTLLLHYVFFDESSRFRPFVGAGVNYTHFYNRTVTSQGQAVFGGPTEISLSNSIGPAVSLGAVYRLKEHWEANVSINYARVKSDLTANTEGIVRATTVDFRPTAVVAAVGYKF